MDLQTGRSAAAAAPTHPLEWLRRSWLEAASEVAPGDPSLGELLDSRLAALGSRGDTGEAALLLVVEDAAHHALGQGSTEVARQVSRRLRRSVYEFLLAVDAAAEIAPAAVDEVADEGSPASPEEQAQPGSVLIGIEEVVAEGRRRPRLMWDDAEVVGATMDLVADEEDDDTPAAPRLTVLGPDAEAGGGANQPPADDASRVPESFRRDESSASTPIVVPSYLAWADVLAGEAPTEAEGVAADGEVPDAELATVDIGPADADPDPAGLSADVVAVEDHPTDLEAEQEDEPVAVAPVEPVPDETATVEAPTADVEDAEISMPEEANAPPEATVAATASDVVAAEDSPDWENLEEWDGLPVTTSDHATEVSDEVDAVSPPVDVPEQATVAVVDAPVDDDAPAALMATDEADESPSALVEADVEDAGDAEDATPPRVASPLIAALEPGADDAETAAGVAADAAPVVVAALENDEGQFAATVTESDDGAAHEPSEHDPGPEPDATLTSAVVHEASHSVDSTEAPWEETAPPEDPANAEARAAVEAALFESLSAERLAEPPRAAAPHHEAPASAPEEEELWPMPAAPGTPPEWLPSTASAPAPALDAWPAAPAQSGASMHLGHGAEAGSVEGAIPSADADAAAGGWSVRQSPRQQQLAERMARKRREEAVRAAIDAFEPGPVESERRRRKRGAQERLHRTSLPAEVEELLGRRKGADAGALLQRAAQELGGREVADLAVDAGDRCRAIGQGRAAINCFLAGWRSDPLYETPLWRLADTCIGDRSIDLAVGYLERVCDLVIARGDEEGANAVLRKIVAIAPERTDIRRLLLDRTTG